MPIERRAGLKINSLNLGKGVDQALLFHCSLANSRAWLPLADEFRDIPVSYTHLTLPTKCRV